MDSLSGLLIFVDRPLGRPDMIPVFRNNSKSSSSSSRSIIRLIVSKQMARSERKLLYYSLEFRCFIFVPLKSTSNDQHLSLLSKHKQTSEKYSKESRILSGFQLFYPLFHFSIFPLLINSTIIFYKITVAQDLLIKEKPNPV